GAFPGPAIQADDELGDPVAVHRQEALEVVHPAMPPIVDVTGVQPAETEAHVDRRDEPLPGQRIGGGRRDPGLQALAAHNGDLIDVAPTRGPYSPDSGDPKCLPPNVRHAAGGPLTRPRRPGS